MIGFSSWSDMSVGYRSLMSDIDKRKQTAMTTYTDELHWTDSDVLHESKHHISDDTQI